MFGTANQAGAAVLLIGGVLFVLAAIAYPSSRRPGSPGGGAGPGTDTVATLLRSPSPQVRLAAAEAVLGPEAHTGRRYTSAELRELALDVLLNRDLVRRLADLLRRGGYTVTAADSVDAALGDPAANVVVRVDRAGGASSQCRSWSATTPAPTCRSVVATLAIAAGRFDTRSAVAIFTGQHARPRPAEQHHARSVRSASSPSSPRGWVMSNQSWRRWPRPSRSPAQLPSNSAAAPSVEAAPAASTERFDGARGARATGRAGGASTAPASAEAAW